MKKTISISIIIMLILALYGNVLAQRPYRVGTTSAEFLAIGQGAAGLALGDAYVAAVKDISSTYWNPAGLALMEKNEAMFMVQPYYVGISSNFIGVGIKVEGVGSLGLSMYGLDYGETEVTTMEFQEGSGEKYSASDYAFSLTYARNLVNWFSFGASAKYISSKIWHMNAGAFALDLGVIVQTGFFSPTGNNRDGMKIGMSISNYGTRLQYSGYDALLNTDFDENTKGDYQNAQGQYKMEQWELPLIFRIGFSIDPIVLSDQRLTISADALHPNNSNENVNIGAQYQYSVKEVGDVFLRAGYKALFLDNSQFGPTFGGGVRLLTSQMLAIKIDYAFRTLSVLGDRHAFNVSLEF